MTCADRAFFETRARNERERSLAAQDDCARRVHLELARLYELRLGRERLISGGASAPRQCT